MKEKVVRIAQEISQSAQAFDDKGFGEIVKAILESRQVFVAGAGRSGELIKCMAKRLMHADVRAYVVGETITPPAGEGDLLIIGSGSGETESLCVIAKKAKSLGVQIALITTNPDSTIGKSADITAQIKASTPKSKVESMEVTSFQPMANLFEQMLLISTDSISMAVAEEKKLSYQDMFKRHANLE